MAEASIDALKQQLQAAQQSIAEKQEEYQRNLSQLRNVSRLVGPASRYLLTVAWIPLFFLNPQIDRLVVLRQSIIILELHSIYSIETVCCGGRECRKVFSHFIVSLLWTHNSLT